jgi:radical SAM protein with 4Fe4S-binding SPASM domain
LGFKVYLVTNGCLLDEEIASLISPYISGVQFSLDGSQSSTHDFFRGHGSFDKTISNIKSLPVNILQKTRARITIGKNNYQDVIDFIDFCHSLGIAGVQFGLIRKQGRGCQKFEQIYDIAVEDIYNLKKLIDKKRIELSNSSFDVGIFDVEGGNCILSEDSPSIDMRIDSAGNVYPCHSFSVDEFCMGNIYNSLTSDIMEGEKIQIILKKIKTRRQTMLACSKCIWGDMICHGGCPAEAYAMHGDIFHLDNKCQLRGMFWIDDITKKRSINSKLYDC